MKGKVLQSQDRDVKYATEDQMRKLHNKIRTGHEDHLGGEHNEEMSEVTKAMVRNHGGSKFAGQNINIGKAGNLMSEEEDDEQEDPEEEQPAPENSEGDPDGEGSHSQGGKPMKGVKKPTWFNRDKAVSSAERGAKTWRETNHESASALLHEMQDLEEQASPPELKAKVKNEYVIMRKKLKTLTCILNFRATHKFDAMVANC